MNFFEGLFDFNGDGIVSSNEELLAFGIFNELLEDEIKESEDIWYD